LTNHPEEPVASHTATFTILIPFLGAIAALGPLSNDLYVPSLSLVAAGLGVSGASAQLTMSSLLIGFSAGCLIYGPLSDRYGRKPILCFGLALYVIAGVLAALSGSLAELVLARALQGFSASSTMVLSRAIILDRWSGEQASRAISWVSIFTFFTPVVAPVIGGYVAAFDHWPAVFWLQAGAGALCLAVTFAMLPRVHKVHAASVLASMRAYGTILTDRQALGYMLCTGLAFIGVVAFVSNSSFVLIERFGLEPHQYGYCFSFVMLGGSIGAYTNGRYVTRLGISRMLGIGTALLATGGTLAVLTAGTDAGLVPLLISCLVYVFGVGFVFANAVARTMSRFPASAGAASAVFGVNQFLIGGIVAGALSLVREPSPLPLAATMAFAGLACAAVWWGWLARGAPVKA
jgi:DHA1 family bicyclomycin/chloramphenicol resistance-like MFS transporter